MFTLWIHSVAIFVWRGPHSLLGKLESLQQGLKVTINTPDDTGAFTSVQKEQRLYFAITEGLILDTTHTILALSSYFETKTEKRKLTTL